MLSILAQAATQTAVSSTPPWVIPLITGIATLLGAGVGGLATYATSAAGHRRQTAAEELRAKNALIRDVSVRFLNEAMTATVGTIRMSEKANAIVDLLDRVRAAESEEEIQQHTDSIGEIDNPNDPATIIRATLKSLADAEPKIASLSTLLSEMRLVAPNDVVDRAQIVVGTFMAVTLQTSKSTRRDEAAAAHKNSVRDFVNSVRNYMDLPPHELKESDGSEFNFNRLIGVDSSD